MTRLVVMMFLSLSVAGLGEARGQGTNASLSGRVSDPADAVLTNATVTIENIRTGVKSTTASNEAGVYQFPSVQPGDYRLTAAAPGFQTSAYGNLTLEVAAQVRADFRMQLASLTQQIGVTADLSSPLAATTASAGGVLDAERIRDLPVTSRDTLNLVNTQAGVIENNFNGARQGTLNITLNGVNVMDQFQNSGINSVVNVSTDMVQEVRVITSPADAELGRGSGQVQISTRSGTNGFHGSLFELHRNTALNSNTWFNNLIGAPRNALIRNQFGGRVGGPIVRNKTFFHFLFDGQRQVSRATVSNAVTYTTQARQGIFRFFPGVQNGNVNAAVPTVDILGNPVKPAVATGDLLSVNVLGRDPLRPVMDPTGTVQKLLSLIPAPNNFRLGDGLNNAGYSWVRRTTFDRDQFDVRIDHNISDRHRLSGNWTYQTVSSANGHAPQNFPQTPGGRQADHATFFWVHATSAISPRILNEFHAGSQRPAYRSYAAWETNGDVPLPKSNGTSYVPSFAGAPTNVFPVGQAPSYSFTPLTVWGDNLTWIHGPHTFKLGGEARYSTFGGFVDNLVSPRAVFGSVAGFPVTGIGSNPTITGANLNTAQNLLINLAGSLNNVRQVTYASFSPDPVWITPKEGEHPAGLWGMKELSVFFKDDWKAHPNLTLNIGLRYEYYGQYHSDDGNGGSVNIVGDARGLFGWSGTSFADLYQPGPQKGPLTRVEWVPGHGRQPYKPDRNNFAPAVGLAWRIPYLGPDKTVLRIGYSVGYEKFSLFFPGNTVLPGLGTTTIYTPNSYFDLSRMTFPLVPTGKPLEPVLLTDRTQFIRTYDENMRTPYVQNWNLTVQRSLPWRMSLEVRYVGDKGTKLVRQANINEVNIFESGILEAFRITQTGGASPLLDRMFNGLTVAGAGLVNGSTLTASQALRTNTTTANFFANNNVGGFADYLNRTADFTGIAGELIRRAGLPENLIVANPQFSSSNGAMAGAWLAANLANSTHHALQVEWNKRSSSGWSLQSNYTWGKTLGEAEGNGPGAFTETSVSYRNLRDRHLDKRLLGFHRTHAFRANGLFALPVGPGKRFLGEDRGLLSRLTEKWQFGAVLNVFSGQPIGFESGRSTFNQYGNTPPDLVAPGLQKSFGKVEYDAVGIVYFRGLKLVPDPTIASLPSQLQARSTMLALADESGKLIAVNPKPGTLGNMYAMYLEGPGSVRFDLNVVKRFQIGESRQLEFRADAINVMNRTNFANPETNINSQQFGRITSANSSGRIIELHARIHF